MLHRLSRNMPGVLSLLPEQFMPLPKMTPDMHCPVEPMAGTVKARVSTKLIAVIYGEEEVGVSAEEVGVSAEEVGVSAKLYQQFITEAVDKYGNNDKGRTHVRRSWEKQKCICEILSTPVGQMASVYFVFEDGGENATGQKAEWHDVPGTGGGWIRSTRWT